MFLEVGKYYRVKVVGFRTSGAIVELEDHSTSLIHISKISKSFVKNAEDWLNKDEMYVAMGVQGTARPVELSLSYLDLKQKPSKVYKPKSKDPARLIQPKPIEVKPPPVYRSKDHSGDSLDEMISRANKNLQDKLTAKHSRFNQSDRMSGRRKKYS